jgi:ribosome-associated translation inhibitor RaiA
MQIPLQVMFENAEPSEAVRAAIGHEVERLEKYQHHITGCRVAVVAPSRKHRHGAVYRINIWVTIPPHAIKDAFAAARRQIEALAQRASGKVKLHEVDAHGRVSKISAEEDYGLHRNTG